MSTESAEIAPGKSCAGRRTGFRKLTPQHLRTECEAGRFNGLPEDVTSHGQLLATFKEAAPHLGLSPRIVHAVDWLCRFTRPQDWKKGTLPIVWPPAADQQVAFSLSATRVKALNRTLIEAGLINPKDSPNGRRYGWRVDGRIVEAYGFDLSPLATRYAEFRRIANEARVERDETKRLRRRATIARRGIVQIFETATESCLLGEEWSILAKESQQLERTLRSLQGLEEIAFCVARLERRWQEARVSLERQLAEQCDNGANAVNTDPKGSENGPPNTYKPAFYAQEHTVVAAETITLPGVGAVRERATVVQPDSRAGIPSDPEPAEISLRVTPGGLVSLVPCLGTYLPQTNPSWADVIDAVGGPIRRKLDIPQSLWGGACLTMGRPMAAIALAIVSTKPMEHFRSTPGGYFHGMVEKAKAGQLDLERSIRGLRYAKTGAFKRNGAGASSAHHRESEANDGLDR